MRHCLKPTKIFLDRKRKFIFNAATRFVSFEGDEPPNHFGGEPMARYRFFALAPLVCFPLLSLQLALAQEGPAQGTPQFSSLSGDASTGIVQIGTLDVHFQIPVFQKPAGELPFTSSLQYDNGPFTSWVQRRTGDTVFRLPVRQWSLLASLGGGVKYFQSRIICSNGSTALSYTNFYFVDSSDNAHLFPGSLDQCTGTPKTAAGSSADGWTFSLDITSGFVSTIKDPAGNVYSGD